MPGLGKHAQACLQRQLPKPRPQPCPPGWLVVAGCTCDTPAWLVVPLSHGWWKLQDCHKEAETWQPNSCRLGEAAHKVAGPAMPSWVPAHTLAAPRPRSSDRPVARLDSIEPTGRAAPTDHPPSTWSGEPLPAVWMASTDPDVSRDGSTSHNWSPTSEPPVGTQNSCCHRQGGKQPKWGPHGSRLSAPGPLDQRSPREGGPQAGGRAIGTLRGGGGASKKRKDEKIENRRPTANSRSARTVEPAAPRVQTVERCGFGWVERSGQTWALGGRLCSSRRPSFPQPPRLSPQPARARRLDGLGPVGGRPRPTPTLEQSLGLGATGLRAV